MEHFAGHVFGLGIDTQTEVGVPIDRVDMAVVEGREGAAIACSSSTRQILFIYLFIARRIGIVEFWRAHSLSHCGSLLAETHGSPGIRRRSGTKVLPLSR